MVIYQFHFFPDCFVPRRSALPLGSAKISILIIELTLIRHPSFPNEWYVFLRFQCCNKALQILNHKLRWENEEQQNSPVCCIEPQCNVTLRLDVTLHCGSMQRYTVAQPNVRCSLNLTLGVTCVQHYAICKPVTGFLNYRFLYRASIVVTIAPA